VPQLPKTYDPQSVENRLYDWWYESGYFRPESQVYLSDEPPFIITIPPPNVTGTLHMGHALTSAVEDLMVRYYRMKGARTLYVPGTDHAGIATQSVVEKELLKKGKRRLDMSRSDFVEEVWDWKEHSHEIITRQQKKLGISADWSRERFTLDEGLSHAVITAFKRLYDKGLIYKDTRMVNWDPVQLTGVSDLEVETAEDGEPGFLWTIRYPIITNRWEGPRHAWGSGQWAEDATEWISVATTRPETLLGDTAVAVNPEDERYSHMVACDAVVPVVGRVVPIISDPTVEAGFGTGAVKITPAHDFNDYEMGKRHHLPMVEVLDATAHMNQNAGPYQGLDRYECRKRIVEDLKKEGLLVKIEDYRVRLGRGQRSHAVIEPRVSTQWFCNMQGMADQAMAAVRDGRIRIVPDRFEKIYFHWLENIRDWCISRQLWWGHQIPVWYPDSPQPGKPPHYCATSEIDAYDQARKDYGDSVTLTQDSDVLDTWFSSGLWPFSTLGWPDDTEDLRNFYPTTMMETGYDILFFWVARMVMLGLEMTGKPPFNTVYLHGLIRTADGEKMSKSKPDKVVDPLDLIETYGTDAMRFYLITAGSPGGDVKMDVKVVDGKKQVERIEGARNFANKLWNAVRFVLGKIESAQPTDLTSGYSLADTWIRARGNQVVSEARKLMDDYQYGEAGRIIYEFAWGDVCDWYLELSKLQNTPQTIETLIWAVDQVLRLLHPYMPYVTEELWQHLKRTVQTSAVSNLPITLPDFHWPALMLAPYPQATLDLTEESNASALRTMPVIQEAIRAIRNARAEYKVAADKFVPAHISAGKLLDALNTQRKALVTLARVDEQRLDIQESLPVPADKSVTLVLGEVTVYLPISGLVDLEQERQRLQTELDELSKVISKSEALLKSDFAKRAPAALVEKERTKLVDATSKRDQIKDRLAQL
jgi:valyl-tRNA synthetase